MEPYRLVQVVGVLSRAPGLPMGDVNRSLTIACYLTREGRLDDEAWRDTADQWMASGWLPQYGPFNGWLARQDALWVIRVGDQEEGPQWVVTSQLLRPGEYFTLRRPDSGDMAFRVVNVLDLDAEAGDSRSGSGNVPSGTCPSGDSHPRDGLPEGG